MVRITSKMMRILKLLNIVLLSITIITLVVTYLLHTNRLTEKESIEKERGQTNKDAYQVTRVVAALGTGLGVGARVLGIFATAQEHFINTIIYGSTLVVLLLCYIIGFLKMSLFDVILHVILIILSFVFAKLVLKEEPFSKEVATLPL